MSAALSAAEVLDREYLEIRAKILQIAASLDRLDRGDGDVASDPRVELLRQGLATLTRAQPDRAEQVQHIFSLDYHPDWRDTFNI